MFIDMDIFHCKYIYELLMDIFNVNVCITLFIMKIYVLSYVNCCHIYVISKHCFPFWWRMESNPIDAVIFNIVSFGVDIFLAASFYILSMEVNNYRTVRIS